MHCHGPPGLPARALIVTEVMFHPVETGGTPDGPENLEYIELYNDRAVTEDIGGFAFTTGIHYTFPASAKIPPKTYIVVAKDPAALQAAYGITGVYGPFTGSLDNDGERVTLSNANGGIALTIRYSDGHPWYPAADGTGHSLTRVKFAGDPEEASSWAPSVYIGGTPAAPEVAAPQARLCINELLTNSESGSGQDWIEIYNPGPVPVDMSTVYLSDARFSLINEYKFPDGLVLQPGAFISVDQAALGFGLSSAGGETVFLTQSTGGQKPRPLRVLDAVRFATVEADVTIGRSPDGGGKIVALSTPTRNAANAAPLQRPIVINEIMYQHGSRDPRYEFVELYNRSGSTVSLSGWSFTDGIDYEFPPAAALPAGGYVVVAADPHFLASVYNNLTIGVNLFGPCTGSLSDHSERIRLAKPAAEINPDTGRPWPITVDEVTYYDGGRWPIWADGRGASLELRDPDSDNDSPDAWAASDERAKAQWSSFTFTIDASNANYTHDAINMFEIIMLNRGDVLLDDLELIVNGANRLNNGGFESGQAPWNFRGNHVQSFITTEDSRTGSRSLHVRATGHGDPGANRVNCSIAEVTAGTVTFRGWAKWLRGSQHVLLRTSRQLTPVQPPRPAYVCQLAMPADLGTPGRQNTAWTANRGPDIADVRHTPVLPAANQPITITARVADNDGVAAVTLYYRSEGVAAFTAVPMNDSGAAPDAIAADGIYTAVIPGAAAGTMRAFYIVASDGAASTRFPARLEHTADAPDRTCLVRVGDLTFASNFATYRVWMSNAVVNTFKSRPNLSNETLDCTFVYNNTEVFYNAAIRYRGSPFTRSGSNRAPVPGDNLPLRLDFNPDQRFRLRTEMNLDGTEGSLRGPLQERAAYWFYRKMGLQYSTQEYIWPILNGATHHTYENVQKIDGDYIDAWFPEDSDGALHKIDDYFEYNFNGTNFKNLDEGLIHDAAHPLIKETYRWSFEKRSHRENDDWSALLRLAEMLNTPPTDPQYETNIESVIDPHAFIMALAIRRAIGDWDSYGFLRGKNYCLYYAPNADRWSLIPWDIDYGFGSGAGATTIIYGVAPWFPEIDAMLQYPKYKRIYEQCLSQLVNGPWRTSWGTAGPPTEFDRFLDDAANARIADGMADQPFIDRWNAIKAFVAERRSYILEQLPSGHLEITTNNGLDFCAPQGQTILRGVAPPEVSQITLNGVPVPAAFSANNVFSINVTVALGPNVYNLQGLDAAGLAVPGAADSIAITGVPLASITSVEPAAVCTGRTAELTIHGSGFEPGSATQVALAAYSDEIGFDAMYVKASLAIDHINTASAFLDDPDAGFGDPVRAVHTAVNLYSAGSSGIFVPNDPFAAPYNTGIQDFAIRFTGWLVVPSPGLRHLGVNSDDGFRLSIDLNDDGDWTDSGETIGEHPTARTPATTMMSVNFPAARRYYLVLDYFQRDGAAEIEFFQAANAAGQAPRLINTDSELVVLRDDTRVISATDVRVTGTHTITCRADFTDAPPAFWDIVVTPACGPAKARARSVFRTSLCPNDLNRDGRIDAADLRIIADHWLNPCTAPDWCAGADLDHSQRVDLADLAALAAYWN